MYTDKLLSSPDRRESESESERKLAWAAANAYRDVVLGKSDPNADKSFHFVENARSYVQRLMADGEMTDVDLRILVSNMATQYHLLFFESHLFDDLMTCIRI